MCKYSELHTVAEADTDLSRGHSKNLAKLSPNNVDNEEKFRL